MSKKPENFLSILKKAHKKHSVEVIAMACLVTSQKVESWLKEEETPKRSILPTIIKVLNQLKEGILK